jgi:hypothetical protein
MIRQLVAAAMLVHALPAASGEPATKNGFELSPSSIPVEEILPGGPPRDGIVALVDPSTIPADQATLRSDEWIVGVALGAGSVAYPLAILEWHELVNDSVGATPILVSYCPLCGTAMVFDRRIGGRTRIFGVSGLLYLSDLLLYDRDTQSLWSQIRSEAVTGAALGQRLVLLRSRTMRWDAWRKLHPATTVLSSDTGHRRPYGRSPYGDYATSENLLFPVAKDRRHHPKTPTVGLRVADGRARAFPAVEVVRAGGSVEECFAGRRVRVAYDPERESFSTEAPSDVEIIEGFWFAWMAFHPDSSVFVGRESSNAASGRASEAATPAHRQSTRDDDSCHG